jgi:nitroreductase
MKNFTEILSFRHACKLFAEDQPVSEEDKLAIVEFGRLSPSSYGIEPWHFLVISDQALREKLRPFCWNQVQITSASFIVIYLVKQAYNFRTNNTFVKQRLLRRCGNDDEKYQMISKMVANYLSEQNTLDWAKRQSYIALANMMTGAASLGIDSCPIEGFESENVKKVLADYVDWSQYDTSVIAAFGYRVNPQPEKIREPLDSIATFI